MPSVRGSSPPTRASVPAAAGRVANLSADGALNVAGLQSVLDLRIQVALTPPLGQSLSSYYDLDYYHAALGR
jgi:hypothetical protein